MRISLFFTYGVSLKTWAEKGLLFREVQFYKELQQAGIAVNFVTYGDVSDRLWESELQGISLLPVYEYIKRPRTRLIRFLQSFILPFLLAVRLRGADVLKTNQIWGGWVAVIASRFLGKPLLVRCGYEAYSFALQAKVSLIRRLGLYGLSWLTYRGAHHVVVATQEDASFVQSRFGVRSGGVSVHPNWIDTEAFSPMASERCVDRVLVVGRLSDQKNVSLLLKALNNTGLAVDIVGSGDLKGALEIQARQAGVVANFLGAVPNNQLPAIYNAHRVFVLSSYFEGNPKSLLEAMACGCAVVGTNVPGIKSVIRHGETGLIVDPDADALRRAILRVINDPEFAVKLGCNARLQITEENALHTLKQKETKIYSKLVQM